MFDPALDMHGWRLEADLGTIVLAEFRDELAIVGFDAVEFFEEVDVEIGAAELAVRHPLEADRLLRLDDLADALVLNRAKLGGGQLAGEKILPRLAQPGRAEKRADMVGAERRSGHQILPLQNYAARGSSSFC